MSTVGVILAGGLARRMGGGDKPMREIAGRPILTHVMQRIGPQCDALVLNANGDASRFASFGLPVVADSIEGFAGPLAGILAGLDWAAEQQADWIVSVAGDCPFLPRDLVARFHEEQQSKQADLVVAQSGGQAHPVVGLWKVALRDDLRHALIEENLRKIDRWTARYKLVSVEWPAEPYDPFFNANAPEDLTEAEAIALKLA
jgi:molybdopterin-guanine dinucleotide biosynthesis protein A